MEKPKLSPMMEQYRRIKLDMDANTLLVFRIGDFYELFFEDAEIAARLCNLTLQKRCGVPNAGIPYHALHILEEGIIGTGYVIALLEEVIKL